MGFGAETCDGDDDSSGKFEYAAELCGESDCECDAGGASFLEGFDAGGASFLVGFGTGGASLVGLMDLGLRVRSDIKLVMIVPCDTEDTWYLQYWDMGLGAMGV